MTTTTDPRTDPTTDMPPHPEQTAYECLIAGGDMITVAEAPIIFRTYVAFLEKMHGR